MEDVFIIVWICSKCKVFMIFFGVGFLVEGNFSQFYLGICIDFINMDKVILFYLEDMDVVVQLGVNWVDFNNKIVYINFFVLMDFFLIVIVGGMVLINCFGINVFCYGIMKDWVFNFIVVLFDG